MTTSKRIREWGTLSTLAVGATLTLGGCAVSADEGQNPTDEAVASSEAACKTTTALDRKYNRVVKTSTITGADGKPVRYRTYSHLGGDKAVVVFLQGRAEFIEKYDVLFTSLHEYPVGQAPANQTLADLPITFVAIDHEGQGASADGRIAAHIDDFNSYVTDVETLFQRIPELRQHHVPTFLMSHSLGGLIATRYAQAHPDTVDGLILSSPMLGMLAPPPLSADQLAQVAAFYSAPVPYGLGMPTLCTAPPGVSQEVLITIALIHGDDTLRGCFYDPSQPICGMLTQCLLLGYPNDCGLPPIDFAALNGALQYLRSLPPGCPPRTPSCPDLTLGTDVGYCNYTENAPLWAPDPTIGWLNQGFGAQAAFATGTPITVPTLILSDPHDQVVDASKHACVPPFVGECEVDQFPDYGHELLATTLRANPIAKIRAYLEANVDLKHKH